jgi:hypothetical protein
MLRRSLEAPRARTLTACRRAIVTVSCSRGHAALGRSPFLAHPSWSGRLLRSRVTPRPRRRVLPRARSHPDPRPGSSRYTAALPRRRPAPGRRSSPRSRSARRGGRACRRRACRRRPSRAPRTAPPAGRGRRRPPIAEGESRSCAPIRMGVGEGQGVREVIRADAHPQDAQRRPRHPQGVPGRVEPLHVAEQVDLPVLEQDLAVRREEYRGVVEALSGPCLPGIAPSVQPPDQRQLLLPSALPHQ